ncbi:translation initiation factor eIF-2B epsilon subunit, GEF [Neonectria magnoliae]|uniref:Translation initiation factor eIF-2B epsilon subunit, GEF n=1 Tax=Neonectria magnoliae TaxID=2732573 RepID=A0ABR1I929_9HYPO
MEETGLRVAYRQLDNDLNENALFLLNRLHALEPDNASWMHLRSLCCLRLGRFAAACDYSREKGISGDQSVPKRFIPDAASVHRLLGKLHKANGDLKSAVSCFVAALEIDPFTWDIFADLCDCG